MPETLIDDGSAIRKTIDEFLKQRGVDPIPEVDWSIPIIGTLRKVKQTNNWDRETYNRVLTGVVEDYIAGESLNNDCKKWKNGNIAEQIRTWIKEGKDERDIRHLLGKMTYHKALMKYKFLKRRPGDAPLKGITNISEDYQEEGAPENLNLSRFNCWNPLQTNWTATSSLDENEEVDKDLIQKITSEIEEKANDEVHVLWKAFLCNPDSKLSEIKRSKVRIDGEVKEVEEAFEEVGFSASSIYYVKDRLENWLEENWPEIR